MKRKREGEKFRASNSLEELSGILQKQKEGNMQFIYTAYRRKPTSPGWGGVVFIAPVSEITLCSLFKDELNWKSGSFDQNLRDLFVD